MTFLFKPWLQSGVMVIAILSYVVLNHYVANLPHADDWEVGLAVTPLSIAWISFTTRYLSMPMKLIPFVTLFALLVTSWAVLQQHIIWIYFVQHVVMFSGMGIWFALSLAKRKEALCTYFAGFAHDYLSPQMVRYTRQITVMWSLFFFTMSLVSLFLFSFSTPNVWSIFANVLSLPLVGLMFLGEYMFRKHYLPMEYALGVSGAFRAYQKAMMAAKSATPSNHGIR